MGQVHALEIHFKKQPGQVRAVSNSKQSFGNRPIASRTTRSCCSASVTYGSILIWVMAFRMWWFRKASSRVRRIDRLRRCSITMVTRAVTTTVSIIAAAVAATYHDVFPYRRTAFSATPMNAATTPMMLAVTRDWKREAELNLNTFVRCP